MCILIVMGDCIVRSSLQRLGPKEKVMPKQLLLGGEFLDEHLSSNQNLTFV